MIQEPGFVGIDLAWRDRARTGLAIVDADGRLVDSTSVVSDDEIDAWLARSGRTPVVVAVDAPLIVKNATGPRPCERELSSAFGRLHASCHSSNLSRPWFDPTRGSEIARRHGRTMDPDHRGTPERPAVIEVYPHPAMVSMFGLERVIPYKAGRGRTVGIRQAHFMRLLSHMEDDLPALALDSSPRWSRLRDEIEEAARQVDLNRMEDEMDAIFCAHIAWLWHGSRSTLRLVGDGADGYIVATEPPRG